MLIVEMALYIAEHENNTIQLIKVEMVELQPMRFI